MANRVVHLEIEAKDRQKLSKLYADAFGWKMEPQAEEYGGYIVATTGDPEGNQFTMLQPSPSMMQKG